MSSLSPSVAPCGSAQYSFEQLVLSSQKKVVFSVAFLMATTSVGPGFLTQTAVFTNIYKMDMAFPVLISSLITFGIVMNLWRIVGASGLRIQDLANRVAPGLGYVIGILLALGAVAFNFGNVSGAALGINVLTGVDTTLGALFTGVVGSLLFVAHNASRHMDRSARYLGLMMIVMIAYVAMTSAPPLQQSLTAAVFPAMGYSSLLLPTLTIVGGAVGGYYTGAQRLVDMAADGELQDDTVKQAAWAGISIAVIIRVLLFLAVVGVISAGATLDASNPAADAFRMGAGSLGYHIFGIVLFVASITSVVGNSYMAVSLIKTLFPVVAANEKGWCIAFILLTSLGTVMVNMPVFLLMLAGLVNSIILPVVLTVVLLASRRKDIVGAYRHPAWLATIGCMIVALMSVTSVSNISSFISRFAG